MARLCRPVGVGLVAACAAVAPCRAQRDGAVSSRSYRGHESDADITNFVRAYPAAAGKRLDDCQTCHRGGSFTVAARGRTVQKNPCDFCHLVPHPVEGYVEPLPRDFRATLNGYGLAYLEAGRSVRALRAIGRRDSDGDGSPNRAEIAAGRYPYDESADHNADPMVRGVIAIRVNPLPAGVEDFDIRNGGWAYVHDARVVVYGFGVRTP